MMLATVCNFGRFGGGAILALEHEVGGKRLAVAQSELVIGLVVGDCVEILEYTIGIDALNVTALRVQPPQTFV